MASASLYVMDLDKTIYDEHTKPMLSHINVGTGEDLTIAELANKISRVVGYKGEVRFDRDMPDGAPRKLMDSSRINSIGWKASVLLDDGLAAAYQDFLQANMS
jgi:GDP-L-fucose synthase